MLVNAAVNEGVNETDKFTNIQSAVFAFMLQL